MIGWRLRFQFFDKELVKQKDSKEKDEPHPIIQKIAPNFTCSTSGRGTIICGDLDGYLNFIDRDFKVLSFQAYNRSVSLVQQLRTINMLATVGEDEDTINPTVKLWNLAKPDRNTGQPLLVRTLRMQKMQPFSVTCFAICEEEDISQIALGLVNGSIVVMYGSILTEKSPKQKVYKLDKDTNPVTSVTFRRQGARMLLLVTTNSSIYVFDTQNDTKKLLDDSLGCEVGRASTSDDQDLVIARNEAVYFYDLDGRGPCFGFDGEKKMIMFFRGYLVVVGENQRANELTGGKGVTNSLTIYDLKNKLISCSDSFSTIVQLVAEWGSIFVFCQDGKMYQLKERDTQSKLEILFKKKHFNVAINLANSQQFDQQAIMNIFVKYGNHLYGKGDFDSAMTQYVRTIGYLEPSFVIRKFLDAQRIHNLTLYLQALHQKNLATSDHTTLLLNCYTNLKDVKKLDQFIRTEVKFDVKTAIRVLRKAGYFEQAMFLAEKHRVQSEYLRILLEDLHQFEKALQYFATLEFSEAETNMKVYGKQLLAVFPEQTTSFLIRLCTNYVSSRPAEPAPLPLSSTSTTGGLEPLPGLSSGYGSKGSQPLTMIPLPPTGIAPTGSATLAPLPLPTALTPVPSASNIALPQRAAPDEFIHIFVNQPEHLARFLEGVIAADILQLSELVYDTLLELYLRDDGAATAAEREKLKTDRRAKALALLTNPNAKFDDTHALILCQMHDFKAGTVHLYEKLKQFHEIIQYYMDVADYDNLIRAVKRHGEQDLSLWIHVLSYFSKQAGADRQLMDVLDSIERENLMPPLAVLKILIGSPNVPLSVVNSFISRRLQRDNQGTNEDARQCKQYEEEKTKMLNELKDLKSGGKTFNNTKCNACTSPLEMDMPVVHFFCMHSFHQRCLGDERDGGECIICAPQVQKVTDVKRALAESANQHDQFERQLSAAGNDGFSVIAEYLGRDIFSPSAQPAKQSTIVLQLNK